MTGHKSNLGATGAEEEAMEQQKWMLGALVGALVMIVSGCAAPGPYGYGGPGQYGPPPSYQPPPAQQPPVVERRTEPPVEKRVPGRVEFKQLLSPRLDRDIRLGARPMNPGGSCDPSLKPFTTRERVYARVQQKGGKWVEGWLPAGTTVFCRSAGGRDGYHEYQPVEVAKCGNPVEGLVVHEYVERMEREVVIHERETVVEERPVPYPAQVPQYRAPYPAQVGFCWVFHPRTRRPVLVRQQQVTRNVNINRNINRNININRAMRAPVYRTRPMCPPGYTPVRRR